MSKHVFTVVVAVVIAVSLLLYMFAFQVRSSEVAVKMTFGKPSLAKLEPGYHFKLPWPIQEVRHFDNRLNVVQGRVEEIRTRQGENINVSYCAGWRIADPLEFNKNFGRATRPPEVAWNALESIIRDSVSSILGEHALSDLISVDSNQLKYDEIETGALNSAKERARVTYGIDLELLKLRRLELPAAVLSNVYSRMKEERLKEAKEIKSRAAEEVAVIGSNAEAQRQQIMSMAMAEGEKLRGEGDAKAASYGDAFQADPELAIYLRKLRALREIARKNTTLILDTNTPPFNTLVQGPPEPKVSAPAAKKETTSGIN